MTEARCPNVPLTRRDFILAAGAFLAVGRGLAAEPDPEPVVTRTGVAAAEWETSSPDRQGLSAAAVAEVLDAGAAIEGLRGFVVIRNGFLVGERYFGGAGAMDLLAINSVAKSITSMLVGLAMARKHIGSLSLPLAKLIPEEIAAVPDSPAATVTLEQILSGRTGLAYPWQEYYALRTASDPVRFALTRSSRASSASGWTYNDAMVSLLSVVLAKSEGLELSALAARDLFAPHGIERFSWRRDPKGNATAGAGLNLRTRDLAKLAWLYANDKGSGQGQAARC